MIEEATTTPVKRTRKPRVSSETKPKQTRHRKSGASAEIDKQLAEHIRERSIVSKQLSEAQGKLQGLSDRYNRLSQEIGELLNMQSRMNGTTAHQTPPNSTSALFIGEPVPHIGMPVPPGVGSIPAPRQPASNPAGNVADMARDKDFR